MNYVNELQDLGIDLRNRSAGQIKTKCPKCSHERKKKNDPCLSVNITDGNFNCHNCQWHGSVRFKQKTEYIIPEINLTDLSDPIIKYFRSREIYEPTLKDFKVTESTRYFSQTQSKQKAINFNYFRDNQLINVKYRDKNKNFAMEKNAELIFYNLDAIKDHKQCFIVEGEIDALSLYEAGIKNVNHVE